MVEAIVRLSAAAAFWTKPRYGGWHPTLEELAEAVGMDKVELHTAAARMKRRTANRLDQQRARRVSRQRQPRQRTDLEPVPDELVCCGRVFDDLRSWRGHRRSHQEVTCEDCGRIVYAIGLGPHRRACPGRQVTA